MRAPWEYLWPACWSEQAQAEGWDVFDCGDGRGPEIQYLTDREGEPFDNDDQVIEFCRQRALAGSAMHQVALRLEQSWDHGLTVNPYPNGDELWPPIGRAA